jgi:leucyl-tRNA synthetase
MEYFRVKGSGKYVPRSSVEFTADQKPIETGTGLPLVTEWEKMSKSKYNGADPGEVRCTKASC